MQELNDESSRFLSQIQLALSIERIGAYRLAEDQDSIEQITRYLWNLSLCEAFYPALHALEVAFRNSLYNAATEYFGRPTWFEMSPPIENPKTIEMVTEARNRLTRAKKNDPPRLNGC